MAEIVKFKAFCLERYKYTHNLSGLETLTLFRKYDVLEYIESFYDVLHSYGEKHLIADIEEYISTRQTA